jgi:hypothetical protein
MAAKIRTIYEIPGGQTIMSTITTTVKQQMKKCPICNEDGIIYPIEKLPKAGLAMGCTHQDGTVHRWAEFPSMNAVMEKNARKSPNARIIVCPVCGKRGRVNDYHDYPQRPDIISYVVTHGKIKGTWGTKGNKISRRDRCYITKKEHRDIILKKLKRYIEPLSET